MPRVENLGKNVDEWYEEYEEGTSTHDVCNDCHEELEQDPSCFNNKLTPYNGDPQGDEGWGGDCARPDYDDEEYDCEVCGKRLTERNAG
jgi:hypothetical protein